MGGRQMDMIAEKAETGRIGAAGPLFHIAWDLFDFDGNLHRNLVFPRGDRACQRG